MAVDVEQVARRPLVPAEVLRPGELQELYEALRSHDGAALAEAERLARAGRTLRYLFGIDLEKGEVRCGPAELPLDHRAAGLHGVEAYVAFTTERHAAVPLVVQGAGVGGALTAGGVLEDLFQLCVGSGAR